MVKINTAVLRRLIKAVRDNRLYAKALSAEQLSLIEKLLGTLLPKGIEDGTAQNQP